MIKRYTLPGMAKIWTDENRFAKMMEVEILACEALAQQKIIPKADLARIKKRDRDSKKNSVAFLVMAYRSLKKSENKFVLRIKVVSPKDLSIVWERIILRGTFIKIIEKIGTLCK